MIVSGFHPVREVLEKRPRSVEALLLQRGRKDARTAEIENLAREAGVSVRIVSREELDRAAGRAHNGVAARVAERDYDPIEQCLAGEKGTRCVLFLDEVTDPGNLGSILRTAAAAGTSVVLPERHSAGLTETVSKASAGAIERVKIGRVVNGARFLEGAKSQGFWVFGAVADGESLYDVDLSGDIVICLGAEGAGLRRLTRETCDRLVAIPMRPGAGSLNVGVAAGVLLYEVVRRRLKGAREALRHGNSLTAPPND
jgi:23S rRNA (guanosine2251-2'-O)-methyltransferase